MIKKITNNTNKKIIKLFIISIILSSLSIFFYGEKKANKIEAKAKLHLSVSPSKYYYYDEEEVILKARSNNKGIQLEYKFYFGKDHNTGWISKNEARFIFKKTGYFPVYAEIRQKAHPNNIKKSTVAKIKLKKTPQLKKLRLTAKKNGVRYINLYIRPGDRITFEAKGDSIGLEYKYYFGDGANSGWVSKSRLSHLYKKKGLYKPYALARRKVFKKNIVHSEIIKVICRTHDKEEFPDYPVTINLKDEEEKPVKKRIKLKRKKKKIYRKKKPIVKKKNRDPNKLYLDLELTKKNYLIKEKITFIAKATKEIDNTEYQFDFGDGYVSEWQSEKHIDYYYDKAGKYSCYVSIRKKLDSFEEDKTAEKQIKRPAGNNNEKESTILDQAGEIVESDFEKLFVTPPYRKLLVFIDTGNNQCIVGEAVDFTVHTNKLPKRPVYKFYFGDGTSSKWTLYPNASHIYKEPGVVKPYALLKEYRGHGAAMKSELSPIEVRLKPLTIDIISKKKKYFVDEKIILKAKLSDAVLDVHYQFDFGDGNKSKWLDSGEAFYQYKKEGQYKVKVTAKINGRFKLASTEKELKASSFDDLDFNQTTISDIKIQPALLTLSAGETAKFNFMSSLNIKKVIWAYINEQSEEKALEFQTAENLKIGQYPIYLRVLTESGEVHETRAVLNIKGFSLLSSLGRPGAAASISLLLLLASLIAYYIYAKVQVNMNFKVQPEFDFSQVEIVTEGLEIEKTEYLDNHLL